MKTIHAITKLLCLSLSLLSLSACDDSEYCNGGPEPLPPGVTFIDIDQDGNPEIIVAENEGVVVVDHDFNDDGYADLTITQEGDVTVIEHDIDGDGKFDIRTRAEDTDRDGKIDISTTSVSIKGTPLSEKTLIDFDHDGKFDVSVLRLDTDGDGTLDYEEHRRDSDGDGVPDQLYNPLG